MSPYDVSPQCPSSLTLLTTDWANLKTIQVCLNVMLHFSFVFISSVTRSRKVPKQTYTTAAPTRNSTVLIWGDFVIIKYEGQKFPGNV